MGLLNWNCKGWLILYWISEWDGKRIRYKLPLLKQLCKLDGALIGVHSENQDVLTPDRAIVETERGWFKPCGVSFPQSGKGQS